MSRKYTLPAIEEDKDRQARGQIRVQVKIGKIVGAIVLIAKGVYQIWKRMRKK